MNKEEKLDYLIEILIKEKHGIPEKKLSENNCTKRKLLRGLMNLRLPGKIDQNFLKIQDEFLSDEAKEEGIIDGDNLRTVKEMFPCSQIHNGNRMVLWQGDITRLKVDGIVNAANKRMLGCFTPCHGCIDNVIHSAAGIHLREECNELMQKQGFEEPIGKAKITKAYNLPSKAVIHTVGPIVEDNVTMEQKIQLRSCYEESLQAAIDQHLSTIAFCCISTGEFHFPNQLAAEIAIQTIANFLDTHEQIKKVIINVFKKTDWDIYQKLFEKQTK
ncbi:MAG: protein-ADP-ribose hydrolase [Acetobacterium sp.]